ncbi:MAG: hypothetical protein ACE5I3_11710 [Phycisphaerae bacterium]
MQPATDRALELEPTPVKARAMSLPCPVDRMPRRRRNKLCIGIIAIGALNFLIYTVMYAALGGDAHNGEARIVERPDGTTQAVYYVRGHFIRSLDGQAAQVSRRVWIYSYLHSMSVFVTSAAMIISMLVLARPHILATMRDGWISGQTFVTAFGTLVILITSGALVVFAWDFVAQIGAE